VLGLLLVAWGLSGVARIGVAERGSYERFGAPAAILQPGLHVLLPWPFGHVRRLEFGLVHSISTSVTLDDTSQPADTSSADGAAPASANRLWDTRLSNDDAFLIAARSSGRESFEMVSANIRVLYRVALDDASARNALYGSVAPDALVRTLSDRLLARYFANKTLGDLLGAQRERTATALRDRLQAQLDRRSSGVEVLALVIESMHPPGGAAPAYRSVQAAQITASTRQANETARASGTLGAAARDARDTGDSALATAAELTGAAQAERWQSDADALAYQSGGQAFLQERYFASLRTALGHAGLEIVDHRLGTRQVPLIDLRGQDATAPTPQNEDER
jgi:regulator of protease activity HflC (stomatin/prohibitin superfamily)